MSEASVVAEEGFSLIEALVALAILAVGAVGLVRASEAHVDAVRGMEQRAAAQWVAENRLAELRLAGAAAATGTGTVEMLGNRWQVAVVTRANEDPDLRDVEVTVRPAAGTGPVAALEGFVDVGGPAR